MEDSNLNSTSFENIQNNISNSETNNIVYIKTYYDSKKKANKKYYDNNKSELNEKKNEYRKKKMEDPEYRKLYNEKARLYYWKKKNKNLDVNLEKKD
jgi:hypothetical protein